MSATAHTSRAQHPRVACHLGMHDWMKVRDDDTFMHFACRHCDHVKASHEPWWEFASEAGTGFH